MRLSSARRDAETSAARPVSLIQRDTSAFSRSSGAITVSASRMKFSMIRFWRPRMLSTRVVSRRPGCARRTTSRRSSGRPARPGAELGQDQPEPLAVGRRMMFWTRSTGIVAAVCSTGTVPVPSVGQAAVGASGLAVDEVLADQRLRPDLAGRVLAEVRDPRLGHLGGDDRVRRLALPLLEVEARGRAGLDAADAEVAAVHEAEGVVEDEPVADRVAAGLASRRPTVSAAPAGGRGDDEECCERAPHRTALWSSSQSSRARSSSPSTFEPSSAGASAAPGQRRYWLNLTGHGVPGSVQWTDSENDSWPRA